MRDFIPSYVWLGGDEDGGVTAICDHWSHNEQPDNGFAYHAGHGEQGARGLPYFSSRQTGEFLDFVRKHADIHRGI